MNLVGLMDVVIIGGARTPFCEWLGGKRGDGGPGGRLASVSAEDLGATAIKAALDRTGTAPESVDQVIMGHALQTSNQAMRVGTCSDNCAHRLRR